MIEWIDSEPLLAPNLEDATVELKVAGVVVAEAALVYNAALSGSISFVYDYTLQIPDDFVQGRLWFRDGLGDVWDRDFVYNPALSAAIVEDILDADTGEGTVKNALNRLNLVAGEGPVFIAPSPAPANQVYGYCYTVDAALTLVADVKIEWALVTPSAGKTTGYSIGRTQSDVSDEEGLFYQLFDIGSSYLIWRADNPNQKFPFTAGDEDFELPSTLSKAVS